MENFIASAIESRNITLTWTPPTNITVSITGYNISCTGTLIMVNSSIRSVLIDELEPFTDYTCNIYALVLGNRGESLYINVTSNEEGTISKSACLKCKLIILLSMMA